MIVEHLAVGAENAITTKTLMNILKRSSRDITQQVQIERGQGFPICASQTKPSGYFLPASWAEGDRCVRSLEHRRNEQSKTITSMKKALEKTFSEQCDMF